MPSVWITTRTTRTGKRHRVGYQLGGRGSRSRYGGSFKTKREALLRKQWIAGELAALRVPDFTLLQEPALAPTLAEAAARWQASRVDVAQTTATQHQTALNRALPVLGEHRIDTLPSKHRLALLWLDWSGARVGSVDSLVVGDYDEQRRRVRLRAATTKTRRALWVELHPALADALETSLGPREDRDETARLFASSGADALRTAIGKACKALGVPLWSPHDLRHRRISLLHLRGMPWARIGEFVGQRNLAVTANTYTHVLIDESEVDYGALLALAA
jgi:integrase